MEEKRIQQELLETVREIRDGQKEMVSLLSAQRALVEEQLKRALFELEERE